MLHIYLWFKPGILCVQLRKLIPQTATWAEKYSLKSFNTVALSSLNLNPRVETLVKPKETSVRSHLSAVCSIIHFRLKYKQKNVEV